MTTKECIIGALRDTRREGIEGLIDYMDESGFFTAPCSGGNHLCKEGGLAEHSWNVVTTALDLANKLYDAEAFERMSGSVIIASALHDLGKMGDYGKPMYVPNMIQDGKPKKGEEQKYKQSTAKPYMRNKSLTNIPHGVRSVKIATLFIDLTEAEEYAIMYHDGLYERSNVSIIPGHETELFCIVHWADFWVSHFVEGGSEDAERD